MISATIQIIEAKRILSEEISHLYPGATLTQGVLGVKNHVMTYVLQQISRKAVMENISLKSAFVMFLAFTVMISITVQIVEAKRMLHEETFPFHLKASLESVKKIGFDFCKPPCKELCFGTSYHCVCSHVPKI
ncbi:unnamed protein product [Thlaspi arvense]|uniref:Cyclotide n=1 Tax=Thlaspi arvense TaxID=13288 RepID=A0AAU9T0K4_THLAR|nr:unnamed protein product [Thlaspi arvense]